jgi:hypothetical protein
MAYYLLVVKSDTMLEDTGVFYTHSMRRPTVNGRGCKKV